MLPAAADEGCPPGGPGCPLPPPQSREVNPAPARADGSAIEVQLTGGLPPVEVTVRVLAPTFVETAPIRASFDTLSVPVRYQDPGDVSCGVQALGMALDALPGAAPTSSAMLGLLQDNGMMYDFGTGVEELAYAAQSFGYKGSFAFHGASIDQLQAQLATGRPVVVSLGANGEGIPGHFVTVTGVSADGQWVAYNDPTLGEQVISSLEFSRLWGLQGNSGVVVAPEPPPNTPDLTPWVALAAGLMALVSTTPLGALRNGIGGMLTAGTVGVSRKPSAPAPKPAPKPAPRSNPPEKEKDKEPKKPAAPAPASIGPSEARFITKVVPEPAPVFPSEARYVTSYVPTPRTQAMPTPTPAPVATPSEQRAASTPRPPKSVPSYTTHGMAYVPSAATQGTPALSQTPDPGAQGGSYGRVGLPPIPVKYLKYLPTATLAEWDYRTPRIPLGILEAGTQDAFHAGVPSSDSLLFTPTKFAFSVGETSVKIGWGGSSVEVEVRTPRREFSVESTGGTMAVGQSGSLSLSWDGWNTISRAAYNPVDFTVSGPDDREVIYGSGNHGLYVEQKPVQELAATAIGGVAIGAALLVLSAFAGNPAAVGRLISNPLSP